MVAWVAILLLSHLMCFSPLKNLFSASLIVSRQISLSIEPKSCALYLLDISSTNSRSIEVGFFSIDSWHLLDRSRYPWMHLIFLCFAFFFLCVHSILFFFFFCRSIVPCSPCSLYICFLSVSGQVFWPFMPFDNHVKKGENFENWMSFLRRSNRHKGENFMLKGRKFLM